jgi:hypothetical protein
MDFYYFIAGIGKEKNKLEFPKVRFEFLQIESYDI